MPRFDFLETALSYLSVKILSVRIIISSAEYLFFWIILDHVLYHVILIFPKVTSQLKCDVNCARFIALSYSQLLNYLILNIFSRFFHDFLDINKTIDLKNYNLRICFLYSKGHLSYFNFVANYHDN